MNIIICKSNNFQPSINLIMVYRNILGSFSTNIAVITPILISMQVNNVTVWILFNIDREFLNFCIFISF